MDQTNFAPFRMIFTTEPSGVGKEFETFLPVHPANREIILNSALEDAFSRGLNLTNAQIFLADFVNKVNVFLGVFPFSR